MDFRFCIVGIRLVIIFLATVFVGDMAIAQLNSEDQQQSTTAIATQSELAVKEYPVMKSVDELHLKMFEAAMGDLSLCGEDEYCIKRARMVGFWLCAVAVCEGTDKSKEPIACFEESLKVYSKEQLSQLNPFVCPLINSPSVETRQPLLINKMDGGMEDLLVEHGAYLFALKGSLGLCEDYIKNYVGEYGRKWEYKWYRALSGCRILAGQSTREQEEKDFHVWFGVVQGQGSCSDIMNNEMRNACSAPEATSPMILYD